MSDSHKRKFSEIIESAEETLRRHEELNGVHLKSVKLRAAVNVNLEKNSIKTKTSSSITENGKVNKSLEESMKDVAALVDGYLKDACSINSLKDIEEKWNYKSHLKTSELKQLVIAVMPFLNVDCADVDKDKHQAFKWGLLRVRDLLEYSHMSMYRSSLGQKHSSFMQLDALLAATGKTFTLHQSIKKELEACIDEKLRRLLVNLSSCELNSSINALMNNEWILAYNLVKHWRECMNSQGLELNNCKNAVKNLKVTSSNCPDTTREDKQRNVADYDNLNDRPYLKQFHDFMDQSLSNISEKSCKDVKDLR